MPVSVNGISPGVFYPQNSFPESNSVETAIQQFNAVLEANPEFLQYLQSANPKLEINRDSKGRQSPEITNQLLSDLGRSIYRDNTKDDIIKSQLMESLAGAAIANKLYPSGPPGGLTGKFPSLGDFLAGKATPKKKP